MKVKTAELTGPALDWAVACCEIYNAVNGNIIQANDLIQRIDPEQVAKYSTDWSSGGPIIERQEIDIYHVERSPTLWVAEIQIAPKHRATGRGNTPLTAAMRVFVRARLGEEVDIPEDLCTTDSG